MTEPITIAAGLRVLVAEDSEMNRMLARSVLMKLGCVVTFAADGVEACAAVAAQRFDIAFMDCEMPNMDGLEATRAIRRQEAAIARPRLVIIALTASSDPSHREACQAAGMDDFVSKPFRRESLREALVRNTPLLARGLTPGAAANQ